MNKAKSPVREYVAIVAKLWGKQISGPVLAVVGLIFLGLQQFIQNASTAAAALRWGAWVTFIVAFVLVSVAQYDAWSVERAAYQREAAKNILPEIRGEASNFQLTGMRGSGVAAVEGGFHYEIHGDFSFELYLYNCRPRSTNLRRIELDGSMLHPPVEFSFELAELMERAGGRTVPDLSERILNDGIGVKIAGIMVHASVKAADKILSIDLRPLKVYIVDGLGGKHLVSVREEEILAWG